MTGDYSIPPSRDLPAWPARGSAEQHLALRDRPAILSKAASAAPCAACWLRRRSCVVVGTASAFGTVRDLVLGAPVKSKIAFSSFRDGRFDAYVMNTDGSGQQRLTAKPNVLFPVWSPDGRKVAFASADRQPWRGGNFDLYVMNADGSGLRRLTRDPASDGAPVWSPDGRKIAFTRSHAPAEGRGPPESDVYVINVDGSGERNLTGDGVSGGPTWSPDGRKIAFGASLQPGGGSIYVMNADGSGQQRLTRNSGGFSQLVARRAEDRLRARGRQGPRRTSSRVHLRHERRRERAAEADAHGAGQLQPSLVVARRTEDPLRQRARRQLRGLRHERRRQRAAEPDAPPRARQRPSWSPDGRKIAFTTKRDGNFEVYVMNADGSGQRNLTRNPAPDRSPVWSPGRKGS